jgi:hypothetical protein
MPKPFQIVGEGEVPPAPAGTPQGAAETQRALQILMLSLRVVGQRFITALSNLFTAAALASAWLLWSRVLPNPTVNQIVAVTLYSAFVGAIDWARRR